MQNKNILIGLVVIVVVVGAILFGRYFPGNRGYSVVYMTTGEVYVGKLSTFPGFELKDAYLYQVGKDASDPTKATFQLQPLKDALWAPESMHLVKDNIVFYGSLSYTSKIAETIAGQGK